MPPITVHIPFGADKALGEECNRLMRQQPEDGWALLIDHDVFLATNPLWHKMCLDAIDSLRGDRVGLITCYTNRIGCPLQKIPREYAADVQSDDLAYWKKMAQVVQNNAGSHVTDITGEPRSPSGVFMLTPKKAWQEIDGFQYRFLGMDTAYAGELKKAGFHIYRMDGLLVYHAYRREWKKC
jgi:GT2 family glycosyltransferase